MGVVQNNAFELKLYTISCCMINLKFIGITPHGIARMRTNLRKKDNGPINEYDNEKFEISRIKAML